MNRRILKKQRKNNILIVDMNSIPTKIGWDLEDWLYVYKNEHIVMYDSTYGDKPFFTNPKAKIILKDISKNV